MTQEFESSHLREALVGLFQHVRRLMHLQDRASRFSSSYAAANKASLAAPSPECMRCSNCVIWVNATCTVDPPMTLYFERMPADRISGSRKASDGPANACPTSDLPVRVVRWSFGFVRRSVS